MVMFKYQLYVNLGHMSERNHRIRVPIKETVVDDGPHAGQVSYGYSNIWEDDHFPNVVEVGLAQQKLPAEMVIVEVEGAKRQFGLKESMLAERGNHLIIERQKLLRLGWRTLEVVEILDIEQAEKTT